MKRLNEKSDTGVMYVVTSASCDISEDSYEEGEIGRGSYRDMTREMKGIRFSSIDELVKESDLSYVVDKHDKGSFEAFEDGRIDTGWMEGEDGSTPSDRELEQWKAGEIKMYSVHCSIYVERIEVSIPTTDELSKDLGI